MFYAQNLPRRQATSPSIRKKQFKTEDCYLLSIGSAMEIVSKYTPS